MDHRPGDAPKHVNQYTPESCTETYNVVVVDAGYRLLNTHTVAFISRDRSVQQSRKSV